jgi:hypothetical protein
MARNNPWTGRHPGRRRNPWVVRKELEAAVKRQEEARAALFAAGWKPTMATLPSVTEDSQFLKELVALNSANVAVTEKRMELRRRR